MSSIELVINLFEKMLCESLTSQLEYRFLIADARKELNELEEAFRQLEDLKS